MVARLRVICDNDYSGDPDGLFQLAHHLLSPSVDIRAVIGSHLRPGDRMDDSDQTADHARTEADRIVELLGLGGQVRTIAGSNVALDDIHTPIRSEAAQAIVDKAMAESDLPLYVTCGAGLTEVASAYLMEPAIADPLTVVWMAGRSIPATRGHHPATPTGRSPSTTRASTSPPLAWSSTRRCRSGRCLETRTGRRS
jgi:purine nucleosidase